MSALVGSLAFPLRVEGGQLATAFGTRRVLEGVAFYFATPQGSRCLVPEFGVPPLPYHPSGLPAWVAEIEGSLPSMVWGVVRARVQVSAIPEEARVVGRVIVSSRSGEEYVHDLDL